MVRANHAPDDAHVMIVATGERDPATPLRRSSVSGVSKHEPATATSVFDHVDVVRPNP
jgi:hypothetical protein